MGGGAAGDAGELGPPEAGRLHDHPEQARGREAKAEEAVRGPLQWRLEAGLRSEGSGRASSAAVLREDQCCS